MHKWNVPCTIKLQREDAAPVSLYLTAHNLNTFALFAEVDLGISFTISITTTQTRKSWIVSGYITLDNATNSPLTPQVIEHPDVPCTYGPDSNFVVRSVVTDRDLNQAEPIPNSLMIMIQERLPEGSAPPEDHIVDTFLIWFVPRGWGNAHDLEAI